MDGFALPPKAEPRLSPVFLVPEAGLFPRQLGGRWEESGVGWELGPENQQAREIWSSNGQVQEKHSWGGAKVFIMLGLPLQAELMRGAAPVPINSSPPSPLPLFTLSHHSPNCFWGGGGRGRDDKGRERRSEEWGKEERKE